MEIVKANIEDMDGIFAILKAYHVNSISPEDKDDGFVTTNLTREQMISLITDEDGIIVAKKDGKVYGFAMAASWEFWSEWPFFAHMIEELPKFKHDREILTKENSYQYGPICIDKSVRGTGVFEKLFFESLKSMSDRYPIMVTFINKINGRSYAAHTKKAHMDTTGTFDFNDNHYYLMTCYTK